MDQCEKLKNQSTLNRQFFILKGDEMNQNDPYCAALRNKGLSSCQIPVLSFYFNIDALSHRLINDNSYCGLILTSPRAVEALIKAIQVDQKIVDILRGKMFFPVGPKTSELIKSHFNLGVSIDDTEITKVGSSELLASYIIENFSQTIKASNQPLLMPCSTIAKDILPTVLGDHQIRVETIHCYETISNPNLENLLLSLFEENLESQFYFVFFSPSGVKAFKDIIDKQVINYHNFKPIAIGKTTAQALNDLGLTIFCVADKPDPDSLVQVILKTLDDN